MGKTVLLGWCANLSESIDEVTAINAGKDLKLDLFEFSRADVAAKYGISSLNQCFGFLAVLECSDAQLQKVVLSHSGRSFSLAQLRFTRVDSVDALIPHIGAESGDAVAFLKTHNIDVSDMPSSAAAARKRPKDQDVVKIQNVMGGVNPHSADFQSDLLNDAMPSIHRIWKSRLAKGNNPAIKQFGSPISNPKLSVVVPLYGRYDFMQHQLAQFSADLQFADVELIYVLDDPPLAHEVSVTAHGLFETFKLPFKVVLSERNLGFAGANNLGVEHANSERLLLLNSDIVPCRSGWLENYLAQFDSLDNCGILGATLLYEDNTVQHAGMEFRQDSSYPGIWMNHHPYKGVPLSLVPLDDLFESPLTTGACMLMHTELYRELGGFEPMYVLGDFEDSDLCLKCHNKGLKIYVSGQTQLYHLERLSQDLVDAGDWKFKLTLMNGVFQVSRWQKLIEEVAK
ncbi:glycosyltransferase family 2 protein [Neiella marina]|uniref:Glycosyltransferase family 2 protein n=1 Tax=Neiella holothuriorum TaxID=2870530 RepID=A0ABS7EFQ2_9GAMM|nr:glycosyltransferase family 2 protein [Neiella holothuriorum]MBW8190748.1 glycosyltransferase family 2 protein [Neiella holothuriorum]